MKKHFLLLWLLFFGSIGLAAAQNRQTQGVVKSTEGETLPGGTWPCSLPRWAPKAPFSMR